MITVERLDIGKYVGTSVPVEDFIKCLLLEKHWVPPPGYVYPFSIHTRQGKQIRRNMLPVHLQNNKWLVISDYMKGLFCKYCVLFALNSSNNSRLQTFVKKPLKIFSKLTGNDGELKTHSSHKYYKFAVEAGNKFLEAYHNPQKVIIKQINTQRSVQVNENRQRLVPIIETIIFCGRQNIALKGHIDDGFLDDNAGPSNEGNFREILMYQISAGDKILENHLKTTSSHSTFI